MKVPSTQLNQFGCDKGRGVMSRPDRLLHFASCNDERCRMKLAFYQEIAKAVDEGLKNQTKKNLEKEK